MSLNGKHEEAYRPLEGREVFRVQRFALVIGLVVLAISIGVGIIAFFDRAEIWGILFLSALFAALSIPIVISSLLTRLYVDAEGIEHRNGLGIRTRINWRDVKALYFISQGNVIVQSEREKIKIEPVYQNIDRLENLILQYYPNAFNLDEAASVKRHGVRTEGGVTIFRRKWFYGICGIIVLLAAGAIGFLPTDNVITKYALIVAYGVPGLLIFLSFAVARTYVDNEKIMYRNLIGKKTKIQWEEIRSLRDEDRVGLIIRSSGQKIKVSVGFASYELLCDIVSERRPKREKRMHGGDEDDEFNIDDDIE